MNIALLALLNWVSGNERIDTSVRIRFSDEGVVGGPGPFAQKDWIRQLSTTFLPSDRNQNDARLGLALRIHSLAFFSFTFFADIRSSD